MISSVMADWQYDFVNFWVLAWCDMGAIFNFKEFACGPPPLEWTTLIPSTQRTTNTPGYMMRSKITKKQIQN